MTTMSKVENEDVEECEEFCYLDSTVNKDGGCDREIMIRLDNVQWTWLLVHLGGWGEPGQVGVEYTSIKV